MIGLRMAVYSYNAALGRLKPPSHMQDLIDDSACSILLRVLLLKGHFYVLVPTSDLTDKRWTSPLPAEAVTLLTVDGQPMFVLGVAAEGNCFFRTVPVLCRGYSFDWKKRATRYQFNSEKPAVQAGACSISMKCSTTDNHNNKIMKADGTWVVMDLQGNRVGKYAGHASQEGKKGFIAIKEPAPEMYQFVQAHAAQVVEDKGSGKDRLYQASVDFCSTQMQHISILERIVDLTEDTVDSAEHTDTPHDSPLHKSPQDATANVKRLKDLTTCLNDALLENDRLHLQLKAAKIRPAQDSPAMSDVDRRSSDRLATGKLQAQLRETEVRATNAESLVDKLEKEVEALRKSTATRDSDQEYSEDAAVEIAELTSTCENLQDENSSLQNKLKKLETKVVKLEAKSAVCTELRKQIRAERLTVEKLTKENERALASEEAIDDLNNQVTELTNELETLNSTFKAEKEEQASSLSEKIKELSDKASEIKAHQLTIEDLTRLNSKLNSLSETERQQRNRIDSIEKQLMDATSLAEKYKKKLKNTKEENKVLQSKAPEVAGLQVNLEGEQRNVKELTRKYQDAQDTLAKIKAEAVKQELQAGMHTHTHTRARIHFHW